ncbi:MAG TPA: hypothetical protein VH370_26390 [Humisphaera sp.]|nr:hypothetical protein [Humisphaera sp.]
MTTIPAHPAIHRVIETAASAMGPATRPAESGLVPIGPFALPNHWPEQGDLLTWCQQIGPGTATLLVLMGIVYLVFGYNIFKALVMVNAALIGGMIGQMIGDKTSFTIPLVITFAFFAAALAFPLMKWAVAVMGGLFGALIGAGLWRTFAQDPHFTWAGAAIGLVFFGLLSFIIFRGCVMTYMSLQGATMLIFGVLALAYKYADVAPKVTESLTLKPFLLPMAILIPTVLGVMYQQSSAKPEKG